MRGLWVGGLANQSCVAQFKASLIMGITCWVAFLQDHCFFLKLPLGMIIKEPYLQVQEPPGFHGLDQGFSTCSESRHPQYIQGTSWKMPTPISQANIDRLTNCMS